MRLFFDERAEPEDANGIDKFNRTVSQLMLGYVQGMLGPVDPPVGALLHVSSLYLWTAIEVYLYCYLSQGAGCCRNVLFVIVPYLVAV